jgi:hypothetical protein
MVVGFSESRMGCPRHWDVAAWFVVVKGSRILALRTLTATCNDDGPFQEFSDPKNSTTSSPFEIQKVAWVDYGQQEDVPYTQL